MMKLFTSGDLLKLKKRLVTKNKIMPEDSLVLLITIQEHETWAKLNFLHLGQEAEITFRYPENVFEFFEKIYT